MVCSLFSISACKKDKTETVEPSTPEVTNPTEDDTKTEPEKTEPETVVVDTKVEYSVLVKSINGKPLSDFFVGFYLGDEEIAFDATNAEGIYSVKLEPNYYDIVVYENEGYILLEDEYQTDLLGSQIVVECEPYLIESEAPATKRYTQGDVMYDFTVTTPDGKEINLASLFAEGKQAVLINFWYTGCGYCVQEFPLMVEAYGMEYEDGVKYSDLIEIIAVNPGTSDTKEDIKNYQQGVGIPFPMAMDYDLYPDNNTTEPALNSLFSVVGYPTTVVIDRYGTVAFLEAGAILSLDKWTSLFNEYLADDYVPQYIPVDGSGTVVRPKPESTDIDADALAEVVNGTNADGTPFKTTFYKEPDKEDLEYTWPWVVSEDGESIQPSNYDIHGTFSTIYTDVYLKAGDVLTFDYFASCEQYDILYVVVDRELATQISGLSPSWETSYAYVALKDATYEVALCYVKDYSTTMYEDTVKIKNLRICSIDDIDKTTYIFREAAEGQVNPITKLYPSYANVFFNEEDGYYHVGKVDGPLLLADLLSTTKWNNDNSLYEMSLDNIWLESFPNKEYCDIIEKYASYASNSTIGYCPVNEELRHALEAVVKELGEEAVRDNANQWLELCIYYSAYYTNGQELASPTIGVAPNEAIPFEKNSDGSFYASAFFDRVILPRGFIFAFTPEVSGVYKLSSIGGNETLGWICDENGIAIKENETGLREFAKLATAGFSDPNFVSYEYYEAGKTYLIRAGFYDIYLVSQIDVKIEYVDDSFDLLTIASPGFFTSTDDTMSDTISGNIVEPILGEDGFYHVNNPGAKDSFVYCDFIYLANLFNGSLTDVLNRGGFDFTFDEYNNSLVDEEGYYRIPTYDEEGNVITDASGKIIYEYILDEDGNRVKVSNLTEAVQMYLDMHLITDEELETYGCVKVNEQFAQILQMLMDKYTFAGVEGSWMKLCYYYEYVGAPIE